MEVDKMVDYKKIFDYMFNNIYLTPRDLMYNTKYNFCLDVNEFNRLLKYKEEKVLNKDDSRFEIPNLLSYNNQQPFFVICEELNSNLLTIQNLIEEDINQNGNLVTTRFFLDILKSRIYSEIEGTLSVEGVNTTRKRIKEIIKNEVPLKEHNDYIIKNMYEGIKFVLAKPDFNKENLHRLYQLLSDGLLEEDYQLRECDYYRYDDVEVDNYMGCQPGKIEMCMNSLFEYVNNVLHSKNSLKKFFLPHIAHYYLVYIHPYFDYNGRTARMVSFWLSILSNIDQMLFISEAIDQTKSSYYIALRNSRDSHNDMTYFLIYLFSTSVNYYNCYKNIEVIDQNLKNNGIVLTETDRAYLKKILISYNGSFIYSDFIKWIKSDMSKQAAFKILNKYVDYGILKVRKGKSNNKLYEINSSQVPYIMKRIN